MLAQTGGSSTRPRIAALAGIASRRSTLKNALSTLKGQGLVTTSGDTVALTPEGRTATRDVPPLPRGPELLAYWRGQVGDGAAGRVFEVLVQVFPAAIDREPLREAAAIPEGTSTLKNALSSLRGLGLVEDRDGLLALDAEVGEAIRFWHRVQYRRLWRSFVAAAQGDQT